MSAATIARDPALRSWSMHYSMVYGSVRLARRHIDRFLTSAGWQGDVGDVVLVVSELVTNAVSHARVVGELLTVTAAVLEDGSVVLGVSDPIDAFPRFEEKAAPGMGEERGRGLLLVRKLGVQLSWHPGPDYRKTVQAYVPGRCA
ncbi:ATP-binding protein [Streptomyces sp. NPDC095613]|uniref:ATP-binding protein n=1 Tax=Streptomyces sp. NPDC095613 TaxID=3155540 RepID=UPI00332622D1